jgi:hypothetical protein
MQQWLLALAISLLAGSAIASPSCTHEPKAKWMSASDMKTKITALGFKFKTLKVTSGNCYEIYGRDKAGQRVEVYFHPITGAIVEQHKD